MANQQAEYKPRSNKFGRFLSMLISPLVLTKLVRVCEGGFVAMVAVMEYILCNASS